VAIDWGAVRKEFEQDGRKAERIAKRYGCKAATIAKRAAKEGWKPAPAGRAEDGQAPQAPTVEKVVDIHEVLDDGSLWKGVRKRLVSGLHNNDAKLGLEELKVAKLAGEVLSSVIKGERMAIGETDDDDDAQGLVREMAQLTLPSGAGEADEGE